jgi:DNA-binding MarR family transcriptional regulator
VSTTSASRPGAGQTAFLIAQLGAFAGMRFAERLAPLQLTPAHAGLLRAIAAGPGQSQQALSTQLGLLPSRLVSLVDELERDGVVVRDRNPKDRRHHALHLTDTGKDRLRDIGRVARAHGNDFLGPLDDDERATLEQLLSRLAEHHGLTPGVHPGYRSLGRDSDAANRLHGEG